MAANHQQWAIVSPDSPHNALMQPPSPSPLCWACSECGQREGGGRTQTRSKRGWDPEAPGCGQWEGGRPGGRQEASGTREPPSGAGAVPFITSWAVGETWLPGAADRVAHDRQVWPRESAHGQAY